MVVGIRGTVVDVQLEKSESAANDTGGETTKLDVLEGNVEGSYLDPNGVKKIFKAAAGQRVTFIDQDGDHCPDRTPEVKDLAYNEIPAFVKQVIQNDLRMENRIRSGSDLMDRPLKFTNEVTFIAQSASKLYDGQALTRSGDVLVTGLPEGFSYTAYAIGSQTEAGSSSNQVTSYHIYDTEKTEVTSDFTDIKTVDGTLVVDPALVTVWTGSAEKVYDGTPLVNPDALLRFTAGYQKGQTVWRNLSYNLTENEGTQTLYGICGETLVHGTNPLTMDTQELILHAGQKLVVCLHEKGEEEGSIEFEIKTLKEEEIPESILRLYANNPDLLEQALKDTEWDKEIIEELIRKLPESVEEPILQDTLLVEKDDSDKLLKDCTNVKITIDTDVTEYYERPLEREEAHFLPVALNPDITVKATGSQTEPGSSKNSYTIDWGNEKAANYTLKEDLGTLTVHPLNTYEDPVTFTAASARKVYDGTALEVKHVTADGLPDGFTFKANVEGSQTLAGKSENTIRSFQIFDKDKEDVTSRFTNVLLESGVLEVEELKLQVDYGAAEESYYGDFQLSPPVVMYLNGTHAGEEVHGVYLKSKERIVLYTLFTRDQFRLTIRGGDSRPGTYTLTGSFDFLSGNSVNYNFSSWIRASYTIHPRTAVVTTGSATKVYDGTPLVNTEASITGLADEDAAVVTATGSITEVGSTTNTYTIDWRYTDKDCYILKENLGTLTVTAPETYDDPVTLTAASASKTYDGTPLTDDSVSISGLPEGFTVTAAASGSQTDAGSSANVVDDDYVIRNAEGEDKTSYFTAVKRVDGVLTVNPKAVTVTTGSASKIYDGTALTNTEATIDGLVGGESVTLTAVGTITEIGTTQNNYTIIWDNAKESNYTITENLGMLSVTAPEEPEEPETYDDPVILTAASASKTYDGTALTDSSVTASGLPEGFSVEATASGSQTDAGSSANVVDSYVIKNAEGEDKTESFTNVTKVEGTLTVDPKAVTITADSDTKVYDGIALMKESYTSTSLAEGDSIASVTITGSQTVVGTSYNVPSAAVIKNTAGDDVTANYEITYAKGTLEVTKKTVTITAGSDTKVYDGTTLAKGSYTSTTLIEGDSIASVTVTGSQTVVGTSDNVPSAAVIKNAAGDDVTESYKITYTNGTLEVTKKALTITAASDTKVYDGTELTKNSYTNTSLAEGDSFDSVTVTGSQTVVGTSDNVPSAAVIRNASSEDVTSSYEITYTNGSLEVTKKALTITAASDTKVYDGAALTKESYTNTSLAVGDNIDSVTVTGSQTVVGESDNVPSAAVIKNAANEDVTSSYEITYANGTLKVTQNQGLIITADSDTKVYDGTALTKNSYQVAGLGAGDSVKSVTITGSQTIAGKTDNIPSAARIENAVGEDVTSNYEITYANGTLEVTKKAVTITADSDTKVYDGTPLTKDSYTSTALAEGDSITSVTITGSQTAAGTSENTPGKALIVNAEENDVTTNYDITYAKGTLEVTKKTVTITADSDTKAYDGTALTKDTYTSSTLVEGDSIASVTVTGSQTIAGTSDNVPSEALIINAVEDDVTSNYEITYSNGMLEVTKKAVTITADSDSKEYDGTELTKDGYTNSTLADGDSVSSVTVTGSQTVVGTSDNKPSAAVIKNASGIDVTASYEVAYANGTLKVTKKAVTITADSNSKEYDGTELTKDSYTNTALADGDSIASVTVTGSQTVVGTSDNKPSAAVIKNASGVDVTASYEITYANGKLKVTKKAVTITADSDSKEYDGTELTKDSYTNTALADGDSITSVTITGNQTVVGTSDNKPSAAVIKNASDIDVTANYEITYANGTLEVTKKSVTITAGSNSKEYDGTPLTNNSFTNTALVADDSIVSVTFTGSQTIAGTSDNVVSAAQILSGSEEDVTANYDITYIKGTLEVAKKNITITAGGDTKTYDGTPLTKNSFTNSALAAGDSIETVTVTGSQTAAGKSNNVPSTAKIVNTNGENVTESYAITYVNGTLEVTKKSVTITADSDSKVYDGTPLTKNSATNTALATGDSIESVTVTGSQTAAGKSGNVPSAVKFVNANSENVTESYEVTYVNGELEVTKKSVTITADSDSKVYDASPLTKNTFTNTALATGDSIETVTVTGSQTVVGNSNNVPSEAKIVNANGENVTESYEVTYVNGELEVSKKSVMITADSDSKKYDGTALIKDSYTNSGLAAGDSIESATVTGSQTVVGTSDNIPSAAVIKNESGEDVTANYEITYMKGELKVTKKALTITAGSNEKEYDGTPLIENSYTNTELAAGDSIESVTVTGSQKDVNTSDTLNNLASEAKIVNSIGTDVTANYEITYINGSLVVTPLQIEFDLGRGDTREFYESSSVEAYGITGKYKLSGESVVQVNYEESEDDDTYYLIGDFKLKDECMVRVTCRDYMVDEIGLYKIDASYKISSGMESNYQIKFTGNYVNFIKPRLSDEPTPTVDPDPPASLAMSSAYTMSSTRNVPSLVDSVLLDTLTFSEPLESPISQDPTETLTPSPEPSETPALPPVPIVNPTPSLVISITPTPTLELSETPTPIPPVTPTPMPSETPVSVPSESPRLTPVPSETPKPTPILSGIPTPILSGMELMTK